MTLTFETSVRLSPLDRTDRPVTNAGKLDEISSLPPGQLCCSLVTIQTITGFPTQGQEDECD